MTREEQLAIEAKRYYPDDINCYDAFLHGVKWERKHQANVWHDVSEEPLLEETEIIFINERDFAHISKRKDGRFSYSFVYYSWDEYVNSLKIKKWAYVKDLLPKGGEK